MNKKSFFIPLRLFILLSPVGYAALGRVYMPLFYLVLIYLAWQGFRQPRQRPEIPFEKAITRLFAALPLYMLLQVIPLPMFLLRLFSPTTVRALNFLNDTPPSFHSVSLVPAATFMYALQLTVFALFCRMILSVKWEKPDILTLLNTIVYSALLLLAAGLSPFLTLQDLFVGFYLVMVFPLPLVLFLRKIRYLESSSSLAKKFFSRVRRKPVILGHFAAFLLLLSGVYLTQSRTAMLALLLAGLLFTMWTYYFRRPRGLRKKLRRIFVVVILLAAVVSIRSITDSLMRAGDDQPGDGVRWRQTLSIAKSYPLAGTGFNTWESANTLYDRHDRVQWTPYANNGYLEVLAEGGLAGMTLLLLLIAGSGYALFKLWRPRRHPQVRIIGLGIVTALFAAGIHFMFNATLRLPPNLLVFALLITLGIKLSSQPRPHPQDAPKG